MATKKKAAKKTIKTAAIAVSSNVNWIPFCVQIEHSEVSRIPIMLSILGHQVPNSLYFAYQNPPPSGTVTLSNGLGLFIGHGGSGDLSLQVDPNGMTEILVLDQSVKITKPTTIQWGHQHSLRGPRIMSGGGIIVDA